MKNVYTLVFTLVVIFNSVELSSQALRSPSSGNPVVVPSSLQKPLRWIEWTFPEHSGLKYYSKGLPNKCDGFHKIRAGECSINVNEANVAFGIRLSRTRGTTRMYNRENKMVAITIGGLHMDQIVNIRELTEREITFLYDNPFGVRE